jgi:ATP-dependent Lhr-like helicase
VLISRLFQGQKRLVFVDSRSKVEELGTWLKENGVRTFVTHSSLSQEQRHAAEEAFASGSDCVIVATSVLELGIDVGDLDRVIQIDSPGTVAGFLQRMGRTGRRSGSERSCLFLATTDEDLLLISGIVALWERGFVESVTPPPLPLHILAQQTMALALQQRGVTRRSLREWLNLVPPLGDAEPEVLESILTWMIDRGLMWDDNGVLWFGEAGEKAYGRRNFLELFSVFLVPPVFEVMHGRHHIGSVDELAFVTKHTGPKVLLLGGMAWQVNHIEWSRKIVYVEPVKDKGVAKWTGTGRPISVELARMIRSLLAGTDNSHTWTRRAGEKFKVLRDLHPGMHDGETTLLVNSKAQISWFTFAGTRANLTLAPALSSILGTAVKCDALALHFDIGINADEILAAVSKIRSLPSENFVPQIDDRAIQGLKFSDCLPPMISNLVLSTRFADPKSVIDCLYEPVTTFILPRYGDSAD